MKRILGLDLGISSIGWAVIETNDDATELINLDGIGSRILMLEPDESTGYSKGSGESRCQKRTAARQLRRQIDRWQQRRKRLAIMLERYGLTFPDELNRLSAMQTWQLRSYAAEKQVTLAELGKVITHINSRRGYKHGKDTGEDGNSNKRSQYLQAISSRVSLAAEAGQTPGQFFAQRLQESEFIGPNGGVAYNYRIKEQVFARYCYEQELRRILDVQKKFYPETLTNEAINQIFDAVFTQRPLKSCKHLVSYCEFEGVERTDAATGRKYIVGPKVAPASSPLAQVCRLWEAINNITLDNSRNKRKLKKNAAAELPLFGEARIYAPEYHLTQEERLRIFNHLNTSKELKVTDLLKLLGLKKDDGFKTNIPRGINGNDTYTLLYQALGDTPNKEAMLEFNLTITDSDIVDKATGEILPMVSSDYLRQPLYQLWHTVYSVSDYDELSKALKNKFGITDPKVVDALFNIDFHKNGYAGKSAKFISKLIPQLEKGLMYSEACEMVGARHSNSLTKEENQTRELLTHLELLPKGALRQPVVEKVLNQMIHVVNAVIDTYGPLDEIRVELARELKRSAKERQADTERNKKLEKLTKEITAIISEELHLRPSKTKIQKYRMWREANECCFYCGQPINVKGFLEGIESDREHVIPRSLFFDDSFSNKVCSCRKCNAAKGQMTGYDFMSAQGEGKLQEYVDRVESMHEEYKKSKGAKGISKTKRDRLLTSRADIPQDFIARDLRQTQYISRKAMEILQDVCRNVYASSGSVTDFFRHAWGYDRILEQINLPRYAKAGQTEIIEEYHKGQLHKSERIIGWNKRNDHRHHAIDALTVALTRQGYIQRLNTLNTMRDIDAEDSAGNEYNTKRDNLSKWATRQPHFSIAKVTDAVSSIAVSFKSANKFMTLSKRYFRKNGKRLRDAQGKPLPMQVQLIPRQPLTEGTVYGSIRIQGKEIDIKKLLDSPERIADKRIRAAVESRIEEFVGDLKKVAASFKKRPIMIFGRHGEEKITKASTWERHYVARYKIESITPKDIDSIIDEGVKRVVRRRYEEVGNNEKDFAASLAQKPLYLDEAGKILIRTVRCDTGLNQDKVTPIKKNDNGEAVGFAKFGNNHHIALYETPEGKIEEIVVPYVYAVERRLLRLPVIVENPEQVWDTLQKSGDDIPEPQLQRLPQPNWKFKFSLQRNEMLLLGMSNYEILSAIEEGRKSDLAKHLHRVQKLATRNYVFRLCSETTSSDTSDFMKLGSFIRCQSMNAFDSLNPVKVRVDRLGNISLLQDLKP